MASKKPTTKDFQTRVQDTVKKEIKLYEKSGIEKRIIIHYPKSRRIPMFGRIGEWLLRSTGAEVTTQYIDVNK